MVTRNLVCWLGRAWSIFLVAIAAGLVQTDAQTGTASILYETNFEFTGGFDPAFSLVGQGGWVGSDNGGNGLVSGFFDGSGQHAFIGFTPPVEKNSAFVNLWQPLNFAPSAAQSIVQFSVRLQIAPSTNGHSDDFRWSAYNNAGARLFTIDFDTTALLISYSLDKPTDFTSTGLGFDTLGSYDLEVWLDFGRNLWSAVLNDVVIVNSKQITATGAALNLADIDAVWALRQPSNPGNNYMVFDDYRVTAENVPSIPPRLDQLGIGKNGAFILRVFGEEGLTYAVEVTANSLQWETVRTFKAPAGGMFDFEDADALHTGNRFFRVRQVP